jgi:hypothetical protein
MHPVYRNMQYNAAANALAGRSEKCEIIREATGSLKSILFL